MREGLLHDNCNDPRTDGVDHEKRRKQKKTKLLSLVTRNLFGVIFVVFCRFLVNHTPVSFLEFIAVIIAILLSHLLTTDITKT